MNGVLSAPSFVLAEELKERRQPVHVWLGRAAAVGKALSNDMVFVCACCKRRIPAQVASRISHVIDGFGGEQSSPVAGRRVLARSEVEHSGLSGN